VRQARRLTLGRDRPRPRPARAWSGPTSLTYDVLHDGPGPEHGDLIQTVSTGRWYAVLASRLVEKRSARPGRRYALSVERLPPDDPRVTQRPPGTVVHPLTWYPR